MLTLKTLPGRSVRRRFRLIPNALSRQWSPAATETREKSGKRADFERTKFPSKAPSRNFRIFPGLVHSNELDKTIVTSSNSNYLKVTSGAWQAWSLSDGYLDMPSDLLRDTYNKPVVREALQMGAQIRLSVNCFALAGPSVEGVLIDSRGGGWAPHWVVLKRP